MLQVGMSKRSRSPSALWFVLAPSLACSSASIERPIKSATVESKHLAPQDTDEKGLRESGAAPCLGEACYEDSDWVARRDDLLASFRHVAPASSADIEAAEKRSLMAPEGAPPDPELEWMLDEKRQSGERLREWCLEQSGFSAERPFESCDLASLDGAALLLTFVLECGGDSCSTEGYVASPVLRGFVRVPHDIGGGATASPQGDALFVSSTTPVVLPLPYEQDPDDKTPAEPPPRDPWGGDEALIFERIALPSMKREPVAPCFSPAFSPKGRWILCRDLAGNVLKVAPRGGKPTLVASSGLKKGEVYFVWYAYIWPDPVEFLSDDRFTFRVVRADGESFEREVPWRE
jgi:hypothetical protein